MYGPQTCSELEFDLWPWLSIAPISRTSSPSPTRSPTPAQSGISPASASRARSAPVGAIVGPIIGIVAVVLIALAVILCRRRRRRTTHPSISPFQDTGELSSARPNPPRAKGFVPRIHTGSMITPISMQESSSANTPLARSGKHQLNVSVGSSSSPVTRPSDTSPTSLSSPEIVAIRRDIQHLMELVARPRSQTDESPPEYVG